MGPASPTPTVSIVIPARNAEATLREQLEAITEQDLSVPWEVIVVDNVSTDATAEVAAEFVGRMPGLRVVTCERLGVNAARNDGVRAARADRVLLCDADDRVFPNRARQMAAALDNWPLIGGDVRLDALNDEETIRTRPMIYRELSVEFDNLRFAIGANLGFQREVFDAIGGFDEAFKLGCDEVDFCWRAQHAGFELGFVSDALVQYRLKKGKRELMRQTFLYTRGLIQLYAKYEALGMLPRVPPKRQLRTSARRIAALGWVSRLLHPAQRPSYLNSVARLAGSIAGFARFRLIV